METEKIVFDLFGNEYLQYLKNKNRGGTANEKGNTFENFYTVYKIVELLGSVEEKEVDFIFFSAQELNFVDDLIIRNTIEKTNEHYQLKNTGKVFWGEGMRSISDDFCKQNDFNAEIKKKCKCYLVVSDEGLMLKLQSELPEKINAFTYVNYFPYEDSINKLLKKSNEFVEGLKKLCPVNDMDKLEALAVNIIGVWFSSNKTEFKLKDIYDKIINGSSVYLKPLFTNYSIDNDVKLILDKINKFEYSIDNGFFQWSYNGMDEGMLGYSCSSEKFKKFEALIKSSNPKDFENLETLLI